MEFAQRLNNIARTEDTVARLEGDQFAILLEQVADENSPARVAQRIIESCRTPLQLGDKDVVLSASIGCAVFRPGGTSAHDLLRDASMGMQRAKEKGRSRFEFFDAEMSREAVKRLMLEARMREGLNEGEFVVHYQPDVMLKTGEVVGIEALVRWQHPTQGLLLPGDFLHVAEETGFVVDIDRWVLREACHVGARIVREGLAGPGFRINVNVSPHHFQSEHDFLEHIAQALARSGLAPQYLAIEITETSRGIEPLIPALEQLRVMGVAIALDDFGVGYSSLSRLRALPVSIVKIDQQFVHGIIDPANFAIVRSVTDLARVLGMEVVAEGIETYQQLESVLSAGCECGQGFLFSKAVPYERLAAILSTRPFVSAREFSAGADRHRTTTASFNRA